MNFTKKSRRQFLKTAGTAAAAVSIVPRHVLGGSGYTAPSDRLNIVMIGVGGQGMQNTKNLLQHDDVRITAIADTVDWADYSSTYHKEPGGRKPAFERITRHYAAQSATKHEPECRVYVDFRRMLDQEKDYDAVVISTPDHTHAVAAMAAIERRKHIYLEKPLAHTISEVRTLTQAARQAGIVTQLGHQGHGDEGIRLTREWIQDGAIGNVTEVHAWTRIRIRPAAVGLRTNRRYRRVWTGICGSVLRRFVIIIRNIYPAAGAITGILVPPRLVILVFIIDMDPAFYALDLGYPEWVEARSAWGDREKRPFTSIVHYQFPARGDKPPVRLVWYEGLMPPRPDELEPGRDLTGGGHGILFVGENGKIMCPGWAGNPRIIPESKMQDYTLPPKTLLRVGGIYRDWIDACKQGHRASPTGAIPVRSLKPFCPVWWPCALRRNVTGTGMK
ncbi:MAG: Gfo/Idh/MocA family oxidoreductase [candidate division KSB1 bacterium]|nr:Gfo/Idh/MocA family oxidoreductase [candidate division KSB1 bacterium]